MKSSTIVAILSFSVASLAAPTTYTTPTRSSHFGKRSEQDAINDCQNTGNPSLCEQVVTAVSSWDTSVNMVNMFLNDAETSSGETLIDLENMALAFANLEPGFLSTLVGTPNISPDGVSAANTLMQVFSAVPGNLTLLINGDQSVSSTVDNINNVRCAQILGNIGELWQQAAAAAGADVPGTPLGPNFCPKSGGNSGDAYN
ncbi:uncharacterized protein LY89DRAFT_360457 [Mollisia scopiformis]|uniref:Uncharacterized protein n=1 Tax=Mollisia scopiformis TaxID=149040 RepID=A0A132B5M2_MOLSC|nr:uncharacterized protein LY89DRAFT_360457 [Mollisia scopiformis]KUJ07641.1 hypothetical protein LY89DRAFT_360457 [Mollisia scopiformis]